ncbi:Hsp20/alpha crystallin family protein [Frateuria defendens]|uniref:Hsp20/alpha crystallin family protein n=1 Tax=Frateuria defendens TaxID=2219559 RepID=UPI00066FD5BF|nr:Hsp20/alpha crystallin family protein [Frateuria defendens]
MATLARWNPFKSVVRMDPMTTFDDLIRGMAARPLWREMESASDMRLDVTEDDGAFHVLADIPGVGKNDIEVSVEGNQVAISAEIRREQQSPNDQKELCAERYYGRIYRSFTLPADLDNERADAHYENGVLSLTLPKKHNGGTRRITVS